MADQKRHQATVFEWALAIILALVCGLLLGLVVGVYL